MPAAHDERLSRKVETIRHVLRLERDQNHANQAVIGGLDAFLERWIEIRTSSGRWMTRGSRCPITRV